MKLRRLHLLLWAVLVAASCGRSSSPPDSRATSSVADETPGGTQRAADFVGSAACAECHPEQHKSYLNTAHSRSLSIVDPDLEPDDADFLHEVSGRNYSVYRSDGRMRHREALLTDDGETIAESDYPVTYLVGSGRHSRTYLSEIDGFLVESPITWYESRREWDVSPGYDVPVPPGFERAADIGCLACHVGSAEEIDGSLHRIRFHELAIGCERCHGPGRKHVDAADSGQPHSVVVATIANPAKLSRTLVEDICAQCHLRGDATAYLAEQGPLDFRPGAPLTSVRVDFVTDHRNSLMEVVGHVEQMHLSRCYTQSGELTCTTCHDMHASGTDSSPEQFYRSRCIGCHTVNGCGLPETGAQRVAKHDDCITCHMPQSETDIPHIAFTHHRIGIHTGLAAPPAAGGEPPHLVAFQDVSALDPLLVQRLTGLAYLELATRQNSEQKFAYCFGEASRRLDAVREQGMTDGDIEAGLAQLLMNTDPGRAESFAETALRRGSLRAESRVNALLVRALTSQRFGNLNAAVSSFEELQAVRRFGADCFLLGSCLQGVDPERALSEARKAAEIQPLRADVSGLVAVLLEQSGRSGEAQQQQRVTRLLEQHAEKIRHRDRSE